MAGSLLPQPKQMFQDNAGHPLIGGKIYTYAAGSLTPKPTYQDAAQTIANTNPVVANARGEVLMYGAGTYRVILKDAAGNTVYDVDSVTPAGEVGALAAAAELARLADASNLALGDALVAVKQPFTGAVARTQHQKNVEAVSILDFGAVGNGVIDDTVAFTAFEASSAKACYLPEGTYLVNTLLALKKKYVGPGVMKNAGGDFIPGNFSHWIDPILPIPAQGFPGYYQGDTSRSMQEHYIVEDIRTRIGEPYYCGQTTPHLQRLDNRSGTSGTVCRLRVAAAIGDGSVQVNSIEGLAVGDKIGFGSVDGSLTDVVTISSLTASPAAIGFFTTPLSKAYPIGTSVAKGLRTMNSLYHQQLDHRGGGDGYLMMFRCEASYVAKAGQDHFYFTSTAGPGGGDIVASAHGVYMTGWEFTFDGTTFDAAAIGDVRTYLRNVNTRARHEVWIDRIAMSSGTQACEVAYEVAGKWKCGIDLARADFSTNGQNAIGLALGQRIYFNNAVNDPTNPYPLWANTNGNTYDTYNGSNRVFHVNGTNALTVDQLKTVAVAEIQAGTNISVPTSGKVFLANSGSTTYLSFNGTNIQLFKAGAVVATW